MKKLIVFLFIFCFSLFQISISLKEGIESARADSFKTVTVTFKVAPTPASVEVNKTLVKYNKDFIFSWGFDDGYKEGYEYGFKYLNGGYNSTLDSYFGGLYYTDGAGSSRPFSGSYSWFSVDSSYNDLHSSDSLSYMSWDNLIDSYNHGWVALNHGWTSMNFPDLEATYNYPAPKGPGSFDYNYEVSQNSSYIQEKTGFYPKHFVIPGGDQSYIRPAFNVGMKSVSAQAINFNYDGKNHLVPVEGVPLSSLNLNEYLMYRKYYAEGINFDLSSMTEYVDAIAAKSTGAEKYWAVGFTHRVSPDATSGNLSWDKFKYLMDYIAANYGRDGADNIWMTSYQEAYEYAEVYQGVSLQTSLSGDTLTISFDTSALPGDLRYYALSLLVSADQEIRSVDYGLGDFTATSANLDSGLINLDWGFFLDQDEYTRSEEEVSKAEASRISNDRDKAQSYVNVLPDGQRKNILQNRIDNIAVLGKTWRINFGLNSYKVGTWNIYGGDKSPYNKLLENLFDTDGNVSSLSVQVVQDFNGKFTEGMNTGNNSGVIPDAYL